MTFLELLKPQAVKVVAAASSKKRLMHDIADLAESAYALSAPSVVEALMERESLGPTGVGHGVALPHARLHGLDEVKGVFILLEKPVEFESVDRQPVDVVLSLFAPADAGVEHLKALALVSRTLRDAALCNKLRANPDAATLHAILTEDRSSQAA
ncbi:MULTISPECIES: PTS sugar transporter subunit IIA [Salipiger]|uniref:PTS IIA-like nitrogen-regulatory protein PtsN n=1 Tax=Salipiger bermudensis (strain DSM 26914 / JCM 13377 / KCTC 12554 / HTCC2601) TaxID=314265 RepID=Q0FQJ7_SALBH|nr:PTS sugar transporter subunit IIA [Salipiger bermudensis]EAU46454.1 PTS IIA-like nitrogen-regulatory protein PtsN [Salipiger bermudensis HTCC2601]MAE88511.1 PTS lactose transporter subunit IIC [Pelagibaca sp.]MBN9677212.1 PTS sugar transporter subunit IIA [Salipiger bermudensis]MBR9890245.1 PTS transporter subunit EIIA [bacterium]